MLRFSVIKCEKNLFKCFSFRKVGIKSECDIKLRSNLIEFFENSLANNVIDSKMLLVSPVLYG